MPEKAFDNRLAKVRERFEEWGVDSLLISSSANRLWLSGFSGSAGVLLVTKERAYIATDFRYYRQAEIQAPLFELFPIKARSATAMANLLQESGSERIAIESQHITLARMKDLESLEHLEWVPLDKTLESFREVKDSSEIDKIKSAAKITDSVMAQVAQLAKPGISEKELAWMLEKKLRENGADSVAFPIIVASGPNAALAHHEPGERLLKDGDCLIVDMGARLMGYNSDLTRTFYLGDKHQDTFKYVYGIVLEAQQAALNKMQAGLTGSEIDNIARNVIEEAGYGSEFGHSLGHGIGLEVHEGPSISFHASENEVVEGSTVTVEPGIYIADWGGVRIEDLVLVQNGGVEIISNCPKEPYLR